MKGTKAAWIAAGMAAFLLAYAAPADALDFFGYFRDSIAGNSKGGAQACFKTPGMDYKLRLGNECDNYGEWGWQQSVWKDKAGTEFVVGLMIDYDPDAMTNSGTGTPFGIQQNYVKVKFPQWGGAQAWAGKQYYRRENIDMIDFFYLNTSEPGVGVEDVDLGFGKTAISVFATKPNKPAGGQGDFSRAFWRPDVRVYGIPVNPNGTVEVDANLIIYSRNKGFIDTGAGTPKGTTYAGANNGKVGVWLTAEHTQMNLLGGYNKAIVQWAKGPASGMGPGAPSFGPEPLNKDNMQLRVVDQLLLQPSLKFQALIGTVIQWKRFGVSGAGGNQDFLQWGLFGRPVYYLTDYFKIQGDAGYTTNKPNNDAAKAAAGTSSAANLFKFTVAPTLSPSPGEEGGFFVRPEIRLFATYGNWNDAAASAVDNTTSPPTSLAPGGGLFGTSKSGWSYGMSVETWF